MSSPPSPRRKTALAPFARVKQHLMGEWSQGRWPPGTLMLSEAARVAQFGVSRMTVNRALRELQTEDLAAPPRKKRPCWVLPPPTPVGCCYAAAAAGACR